MAKVVLKNVEKTYDNGFKAVHGINLEIEDGEFMVLVGPSGCAKSTTLRMVAGLEDLSCGEIYIGDDVVNNVLPKDRGIAMVFQNYALYPHMSVYENMAFALKIKKRPKAEIKERVHFAAEKLEITDLLERKPKQLSGGQKQRVALGRAIVRNPSVFLFDEPLSNLDAKLRVTMRVRIAQLHKELKTTMIYVTHDQVEAMTMGDRICVMNQGRIMQVDTPMNIYNKPQNKFVAGFIGSPAMNFAEGMLMNENGIGMRIGEVFLAVPQAKREAAGKFDGQKAVLGIRPENINVVFAEEPVKRENEVFVKGQVAIKEQMGSETYVYFVWGEGVQWIARMSAQKALAVEINKEYLFSLHPDDMHVFAGSEENNILLQ